MRRGTFHAFTAGPDTTAPVIVHTPLNDQAYIQWPADVTATITDELGVDSAWVEYSVNSGALTGSFAMANTVGDTWFGTFDFDTTMIAIGDSVEYRVLAEDAAVASNQSIAPPAGYYGFDIIAVLGTVLIIDDDPSSKSAVVTTEKGTYVRNLGPESVRPVGERDADLPGGGRLHGHGGDAGYHQCGDMG